MGTKSNHDEQAPSNEVLERVTNGLIYRRNNNVNAHNLAYIAKNFEFGNFIWPCLLYRCKQEHTKLGSSNVWIGKWKDVLDDLIIELDEGLEDERTEISQYTATYFQDIESEYHFSEGGVLSHLESNDVNVSKDFHDLLGSGEPTPVADHIYDILMDPQLLKQADSPGEINIAYCLSEDDFQTILQYQKDYLWLSPLLTKFKFSYFGPSSARAEPDEPTQ